MGKKIIRKYEETHKKENGIVYKLCTHKNHWLEMNDENFHKNKSNKSDGYYPYCKKCSIERSYNWIQNNTEQFYTNHKNYRDNNLNYKKWAEEHGREQRESGYSLDWQRKNAEKVREYARKHRNHDISTAEWNNCLKIFNHKCAYCGIFEEEAKEKYGEKLHREHVDNEGYNDLRNAVPACKGCNDSKHTKKLNEWYNEKNPVFKQERYDKIISWINEDYKNYIESKPPYRIVRKRVYDNNKNYHMQYQLWTVDEKRDLLDCIKISNNQKDLKQSIKE